MKKHLKRDKEAAVLGGVVAGLAKYFNQDPALFRILAIAFIILTGIFPGLLIYIGAWLVMGRPDQADYTINTDE